MTGQTDLTAPLTELRMALGAVMEGHGRNACSHGITGPQCPAEKYAALYWLVVEKCQKDKRAMGLGFVDCNGMTDVIRKDNSRIPHERCRATGYITRSTYWNAAPKGALKGSIDEAIEEIPDDFVKVYQLEYVRLKVADIHCDSNAAALEAVTKAVVAV